ncbi:hypothetical protein HT031_002157 [Scenedesmus sp. PABB004]|nr:hypothetical protein HT031_002157 [Scenedesmus sp. PABB004]
MAEVEAPAREPATVDSIPARSKLPDGSHVLAEAHAFVVLERGATRHCGSAVNERLVQLLRLPTGGSGRVPQFQLVVHPREADGAGGGEALRVPLDGSCRISPALRKLRAESHFVKKDGESLLRAINTQDGDDIKLYVFDVNHPSGVVFFDFLRVKQKCVGLGFRNVKEALGWYVYVAAVCGLMSPGDPDFSRAIGGQGLADHAAAPRALMLDMDDQA